MSRAIRFTPPAFDPPAGTDWVLRRAFGPTPAADPSATSAESLVALARELGLSARIGARHRRDELEREIGAPAAAALRRDSTACAAQRARLASGLAAIAEAAAALATPVVLLKGAALAEGGWSAAGARWSSDLDLLASVDRIGLLQRELVRRGWQPAGPAYEHQLAALTHPEGGAVELHRKLLGVRLGGGRRSAELNEVLKLGLAPPAAGFEAPVHLPRPELLAAHAIAHGLGQHGFEPGSYPPLRVLADLVDLHFSEMDRGAICRWLELAISAEEVEALAVLCRDLERGEPASPGAPESLLRHCLAGALDPRYREALKLRRLAQPFSDAPRPLALVRAVAHALWPSAQELAVIYGPGSAWRAMGLRLWRPIDLVRRFAAGWRARG